MALQTLECKNCGTPLQPRPGDEFVKCPSCRAAHQIERKADGAMQVSLLEAKIDDVGRKVGDVSGKADSIHNVQKLMAQRENAKTSLEETQEKYELFRATYAADMPKHQASKGSAKKPLLAGVLAAVVGVILIGNAAAGPGLLVAAFGGLLIFIGVKWIQSVNGKIAKLNEQDRQLQSEIEHWRTESRRKIEI